MKLAEALQERADLNRKVEQLSARLRQNALVQEGEAPAEDPKELLSEFDSCVSRLETLIVQINLANCRTMADGKTLTELLSRRDCLMVKLRVYQEFLSEASQPARRAMRTEIKIRSTVEVRALQKNVDAMAKELRLLDNQIQACNWTAEL